MDKKRDELGVAAKFLKISDDVPETIIVQKQSDINEELHFISMATSEVFKFKDAALPDHLRGNYPPNLARYAGTYLAGLLESRFQNQDSAVVQMAIQGLLTYLVNEAFNTSWCPDEIISTSNDLKRNGNYSTTVRI